jgi:hypothetical protein
MFHNFNFQNARVPSHPSYFHPGLLLSQQHDDDTAMQQYLQSLDQTGYHHRNAHEQVNQQSHVHALEESNNLLRARLQLMSAQRLLPLPAPASAPAPTVQHPSRQRQVTGVVISEQDDSDGEVEASSTKRACRSRNRKTPNKKARVETPADYATKEDVKLAKTHFSTTLAANLKASSADVKSQIAAAVTTEKLRPLVSDLIGACTPMLMCNTLLSMQTEPTLVAFLQVHFHVCLLQDSQTDVM